MMIINSSKNLDIMLMSTITSNGEESYLIFQSQDN